jgi:RNA polymerase sigma-70 factor (ECF subfamily)
VAEPKLAASQERDVSAEVVERARARDATAFESIVMHYDPTLRNFVFRMLGDQRRTEDALQETYLKAYRNLPGFRPIGSLRTWLFRIAYNCAVDELRRDSRSGTEALSADEPSGERTSIEDLVSIRSEIQDALGALSREHAGAVLLVDGHGFDYGTAAEILGVSRGTIASRLHHARAVIRSALSEQTDERQVRYR